MYFILGIDPNPDHTVRGVALPWGCPRYTLMTRTPFDTLEAAQRYLAEVHAAYNAFIVKAEEK